MKWEDVSKQLPGRSAISCRLHYQNYLERRSEWNEERKDKLAQVYERFKADMWTKIAKELAVPWRAAEAMHWQLGEQDIARRAGVVPFSLATVNAEVNAVDRRNSPSHSHLTEQSQLQTQRHGSAAHNTCAPPPRTLHHRSPQHDPARPGPQSIASRLEQRGMGYATVAMLAPIQVQAQGRNDDLGYLPGIAAMTANVASYGTPIEASLNVGGTNPSGPYHGRYKQQAPMVYSLPEYSRMKRSASPEDIHSQSGYRRHVA